MGASFHFLLLLLPFCLGLRPVPSSYTEPGFSSYIFHESISSPRGLCWDDANRALLVLERSTASVISLNEDGTKHVLVSGHSLNHAVELGDGYFATTVYRWSYGTSGSDQLNNTKTIVTGAAEVVVDGIPASGHSTRTIKYKAPHIYVSIGSQSNVDATSSRSRIMRYDVSSNGSFPIEWTQGQLFADGTRNEVALAFHPASRELWGAENGCDNLHYNNVDVHNNNPGEEVNRFLESDAGGFYGYPNCFSAGIGTTIPGASAGEQLSDVRAGVVQTDAWCQNSSNVIEPRTVLHAHVAPLGAVFADGPQQQSLNLYISCHGSWNSPVPVGYNLVRLPMQGSELASQSAEPIVVFSSAGPGATSSWPHRPVDVVYGSYKGNPVLYVSSDASSTIFLISMSPLQTNGAQRSF